MKNFLNLNQLSMSWNEKQKPQRLRRYAVMLMMLLTLGVGQMWAEAFWPYAGFYEVYMTYSYSGNNSNYTFYASDNNSSQSVDLGTLTADFKVTALYMKCYKNTNDWSKSGNICGALMIYNTGSGDNEYQPTWSGYDTDKGWSDTYQAHLRELSKTSCNKVIASYNSGASGSYTAKLAFKMWGSDDNGSDCGDNWWISNNSNNYKFTYKIAPPAISSFSVAESGYISGKGTSDNPYIIPYNGTLTLTVSGSKGRTDANSTIKYWKNSGDKQNSNVLTVTGITSTTKTSVVVHAQCINNSSSSLVGTESTKTVWYKSEAAYNVTAASGGHGTVTPTSATAMGTTSGGNITATPSTGYNFGSWAITSGSGYFGESGTATTSTTANTKFRPSAAATVTATFTAKTTTVTLSANAPAGSTVTGGGTTVTATYDAALPSFSALTCNNGYALKGYYTNTSGGTKVINADGTFAANSGIWNRTDGATLTLHAQWSLDRTLTYDANGGTGSMTDANSPYANGATVTVKSNSFTRTGYTFTGWNTAPGGGGTSYAAGATFNISANTTLYAQWSENMTAVTISASPAGTGTFTVNSVSGTSASVGVTTTAAVVATAATDFEFTSWTATNCSASPTNNKSTTLTGNGSSATGTLTATFTENVASGWYLGGSSPFYSGNDKTSWETSNKGYQMTKKYRGMDGVFYRSGAVTTSGYYTIHNGTTRYRPSTGNNAQLSSAGWSNKVYMSNTSASANITFKTAGTYYLVVDTRGTYPYIWYETSEPDRFSYHSVNVTGVENAKGTCKVTLGSTSGFETTRFANGETFYVTITGVSGYIPTITIGGTPTTWWKEQATYTASGTMSTSDIAVTISYTASRAVRFATTTGCDGLTATGPGSTSVDDNTKIKDGTVITFAQTASTGYTFSKWYSNNTGTSGTQYSTSSSAYDLTISSTAYTIYPLYTENMTTVNLIASPTGKGTFTSGGTVTSVSAGIDTHPTVTAVAGTGYHLTGTIWSESSSYISLSATNTASTTISATGTSGNEADLTATFTPNTYKVQFHRNGGAGDVVYQDFTYDEAQNLTANTYTKTGYNFAGWALTTDGAVTYADEASANNLTSTNNGTFHLYAKWTPKTATISYSQSGTGYSTGGQSTTKTATYDAAMPTPISTPTAANGWAFMGYYDALEPLGTQYYNADGTSARTWDKEDATATLYAYFKKAEITALEADPGVIAPDETITITPTISPTPTGTTKVCYELQYSNGTPLPSQPTFTPGEGNAVSFTVPHASATYKIEAKLAKGSDCPADPGDVLSTRTTTFQVAGDHTVTVRYQDSEGRTLAASTEITGKPLEWTKAGDITPPTITGYTFARWDAGDGVTIKNGESDPVTTTTTSSIQIKAVYDGTLTAVYNKKNMIYFNNTLGWEDVWVYFYNSDKYWSDGYGTGAYKGQYFDNCCRPYWEMERGHMTKIEGTNIWYFDYTAAGYSTRPNVAFTNMGDQSGVNPSGDDWSAPDNDQAYFSNTTANPIQVIRRSDHKSSLPMFVPLSGQTGVKRNENRAVYYSEGYWMNYPENTGYTLKIYNAWNANRETAAVQSIAFPYSEDKTMPLKMDVELSDGYNHDYWFMVYRNDGTYWGNEYHFKQGYNAEQTITNVDKKSKITTSAPGNYTFTLTYHDNGSGTVNYYIDVDFPIATGDYRIYYSDNATWSKAAHTKDSWCHPSHSIGKATTEAKKDTISFFIPKGEGISHTMKFQKASVTNDGDVSWSDVDGGSITIPSSVTTTGVYNFIVSQPAGGASISLEKAEPYTGNYYIRTDCAGNTKWDSFKNLDHQMTYSDYAENNSGFSHYYAHWVESGVNVKFVIANDYSMCITDTLIEDYGTTIANISNIGALNSGDASIRFMWNQATNKISRAYISGSSNISDRFLVLEGDAKMFDAEGNALSISGLNANEINLVDDQNFVYEREIKVQTGAKAKLTAKYNSNIQYFKGGSGSTSADSVVLLGGSASATKHTMRIVYDFKTNRLVTAYVPSGTIENEIAINADLMIVREHQEAGQQLLFNGGSLSEVHTVYGVMRFNRWTLNNKNTTEPHGIVADPKSAYERGLYWISFPFDVKLSDVFGFGTYGTHWILMEYDGAKRATEGYWVDSKGFWEYVMPSQRATYELKAGKGYVLALDLDLMRYDDDSFWTNNIEQVELFFPSASYVSNIASTNVTTTVASHECTIDRTNNNGADINKNRTKADSHWNIIGVPSYANYGTNLTSDGSTTITWRGDPGTANLPYLYEWNAVDNSYSVQSGSTYPFKSMHAYMVQYHGDLYWSLASATPVDLAPRRYEEAMNPVEYRLELQQNEKMVDQAFVKMSNDENVNVGFSFDEDLCKEYNANKANIYTFIEGYIPAAGNTLPMSEQTTVVPVGVKIATNGEYTFAMPDGTDGIGITLIDNETGIRTPLSALDYTVNLSAGTYNKRFVLEISPISQVLTDIDNVQSDDVQGTKARKVMIDGIMYIVKDGKVFDATGQRVK